MSILPVHRFFAYNNDIKPVSLFIQGENEGGIYEVLRVVNGVPLFLEDHLTRFSVSAKRAGIDIKYSKTEIEELLKKLITANKITEGNILVSCKINLNACFIAHNYPEEFLYNSGISCGLLHAERKNPNVKVLQTTVRKQADEMMAKNEFYEVLLVDRLGRITEGSRSNVFFVLNNRIITPPGNEVLIGVTRTKAILIAKELGYQIEESDVRIDDLSVFNAAFLTGTSPKILPVKKIEQAVFDPKNDIVRHLIKDYEKLILQDINESKSRG